MNKPLSVIAFAGGGSGGHVYPTLAVIDMLQKKFSELGFPVRMVRVGPSDGYDPLFIQQGVTISRIAAGKIRRYSSFQNFLDIPKFFFGFLQALFKLYFIMPEAIFSKGGTGALPVIIAGWFYRIPIIIHESDARPGLTNLLSAHFATKIFVSFAKAADYFDVHKCEVVGTPVREDLTPGRTTKELAKETLGFDPASPLMLILGGSQGSQRINQFILEHLGDLIATTQIFHQTGLANLTDAQKLARAALIDESYRNRYQAIGYLEDNMVTALTAADLVVARAGSGTIFELAAMGLPAILIPLPESANGHQRLNAYEFSKTGAAVVIEESNLFAGIFINQVKTILTSADLRTKMSAASHNFFVPSAAEKISLEILENLR